MTIIPHSGPLHTSSSQQQDSENGGNCGEHLFLDLPSCEDDFELVAARFSDEEMYSLLALSSLDSSTRNTLINWLLGESEIWIEEEEGSLPEIMAQHLLHQLVALNPRLREQLRVAGSEPRETAEDISRSWDELCRCVKMADIESLVIFLDNVDPLLCERRFSCFVNHLLSLAQVAAQRKVVVKIMTTYATPDAATLFTSGFNESSITVESRTTGD
ncbi:hypothetical protein B0H63DRAFT_517535 [Podospora didyma]|uniref:Uncharacterized protein n=1 Tax=Podospora didyma TaxID=330526 RepID=A0AAE0U810_9PEZI|nr:hypothetical protein B0H63DRAFT_517535 [Podospora didyma]